MEKAGSMSVFSSKKTQHGVYAAEEAKEKTQTVSMPFLFCIVHI